MSGSEITGAEQPDDANSLTEQEVSARELEALQGVKLPKVLHDRLPIAAIIRREVLFQPRREMDTHVADLRDAIRRGGMLDAIMVIQVGGGAYLVDGHHRWTAYAAEGVTVPVPVSYFTGTIREAVLVAISANAKAKLVMSRPERDVAAWRLVGMPGYTRPQIVRHSGVSDATVGRMRDAMRKLGAEASECRSYEEARARLAGRGEWEPPSEAEMQETLERMADGWRQRLGKEFGHEMTDHTEVASWALRDYFGRKLPELVRFLSEHVPEPQEDEDSDF